MGNFESYRKNYTAEQRRFAREVLGFTQQEVAQVFGRSRQRISECENPLFDDSDGSKPHNYRVRSL